MKVIKDLKFFLKERRPVVLAVGFFDGLHRGHRKVINKTVAEAKRLGGIACVLTFDQHPMKILRPVSAPLLLTSNLHKVRLLENMDVDGCLLMPFTRQLAGLEPEAFVKLLSATIPTLSSIFVGENWRFGRRERGDSGMLIRLARRFYIKVTVVKSVLKAGRIVSSTRIREKVASGNLSKAGQMLGRPFSILGNVIRGRAVGRMLGFPTANMETYNEVLPPTGVYAVRVLVGREMINGVANIGVSPTFPGAKKRKTIIEVHLLDVKGNYYGRELEVFFVRKLRDEKRFKSVKALKEQIEKDVRKARAMLR